MNILSLLTDLRWLIALLTALLTLLGGCGPKSSNMDEFAQKADTIARTAYELGLDVTIDGTFGDGHCVGAAFNFTGLHGSFHMSGKPRKPTPDLPKPTSGPVR